MHRNLTLAEGDQGLPAIVGDIAEIRRRTGFTERFLHLRGSLKSRLRVTDHRRVMPITINADKLYDTDLTVAAWALIAPMLRQPDPVADHAQPTFALC